MFQINSKIKILSMASIISAGLVLGGCSDGSDPSSMVRVIHTSPDAPPVNVKLDDATVITNLDYAESTGFKEIDAGKTDVVVEAIVPSGNLDVITVADFDFAKNTENTIMAVNNTAGIEALVVTDSSTTPASNEVAVNVVHASPAAALVDVYVTANGVDLNTVSPNFSFDFKGSADAGALPASTYQIRVTGSGSKTPVYDSGAVDLAPFASKKLLIAAVSTVNDTSQAASPIKLLVVTADSHLELLDASTQAGARVVHLGSDADATAGGPVEVFANTTTELIPSFSYTDIVPSADSYVTVAATSYVFDVSVDGAGVGASVFTSPTTPLQAGMEYSVVAAGLLGTTPAFDLLATADNNRSIATQASIKVIHAAPAAGLVDVFVTEAGAFTTAEVENGMAGDPLLDDFAFAAITDYVAVAPGSYDIRVVAGGATAIDVTAFALAAGDVATVIARQPNSIGAPTDFNVVVLTN